MQTDFFGLTEDDLLERIDSGEMLTAIAASVGKSKSMLGRWIAADEGRSARVREARILAAEAWDAAAQAGIEGAADPFELAKAKEIAHHLRWRASKIAPKVYGDKIQTEVTGKDGGPVQVSQSLSPEVAALAAALRGVEPKQ